MVGILIAALVYTGSDDWLWWKPPVSVDPAYRLGYSRQAIAKMPIQKWSKTAFPKAEHFPPDTLEIVYGDALRFQNRRIAAKQGKAVNQKMERARFSAFRFGMACIAVEDTLAGGGTYSIHLPKALYVESEQMISSL